jgi:acyl carrier protein
MADRQDIFAKIVPIIAEQLKIEPAGIKLSSRLIEDLSADSLDSVEIVMCIEEKFNIEIPDEEIDQIKTVEDIVVYLANKVESGRKDD